MRGALKAVQATNAEALERVEALQLEMERKAGEGDEPRLTELDISFHQTLFRLSGLEALEQILMRCILHAHRWRLWAPSHRRPLMETARRHRPIIAKLAAKDGEGLAEALGHHIDTIVTKPRKRLAHAVG
jgi:DNA-binding GntR family transcriptional regulator